MDVETSPRRSAGEVARFIDELRTTTALDKASIRRYAVTVRRFRERYPVPVEELTARMVADFLAGYRAERTRSCAASHIRRWLGSAAVCARWDTSAADEHRRIPPHVNNLIDAWTAHLREDGHLTAATAATYRGYVRRVTGYYQVCGQDLTDTMIAGYLARCPLWSFQHPRAAKVLYRWRGWCQALPAARQARTSRCGAGTAIGTGGGACTRI